MQPAARVRRFCDLDGLAGIASSFACSAYVELGFAFAKALVVHNDGDANVTVSVNRVTPANDPDLARWSEITEASNVVIAPGDPPLVLRQTYEPQALGAHSVELEVLSNDSAAPDTAITLTGEGVTPRPVDSLLVLDRSGSMADLAGDRTKIEAMRDAVMLFTDLLRDDVGGTGTGDQLGFVKYNDTNSVYMPMTSITQAVQDSIRNNEPSDSALSDSSALQPGGTTGIGGAMLTGAAELGGADPDRGKVMVRDSLYLHRRRRSRGQSAAHPDLQRRLRLRHRTNEAAEYHQYG